MLKQTQKEVPYIQIFKLGTGEEFIAKVVEETLGNYLVNKPLCMVPTQEGLRFAPLLMMANMDKNISIPKPVIHAEPASDLEQQYESITTGVALPKKQGIITV